MLKTVNSTPSLPIRSLAFYQPEPSADLANCPAIAFVNDPAQPVAPMTEAHAVVVRIKHLAYIILLRYQGLGIFIRRPRIHGFMSGCA
jgi:hypothetical protein